jgi:hypothetical protein
MSSNRASSLAVTSPRLCKCGCFTRQPRYPSDLTDAQWEVIAPLLPVPLWQTQKQALYGHKLSTITDLGRAGAVRFGESGMKPAGVRLVRQLSAQPSPLLIVSTGRPTG